MKRILSIFLAVSMILPVLFSCGKNGEATSNDTTALEAGDTTEAPDPRSLVSDELPERDYKGRLFNFFCRTAQLYEFNVDSQIGEVVNDAVFYRNKTVEERFNVKINTIDMDGSWANMAAYKAAITNSVKAGDGAYDMIEGDTAISDLLGNNYFVNLLDMEYIHPDKPWWSQASVKSLNIGGVLEFISGDLSLLLWEGMCVVFFNKQLVTDYSIDNPYQLVRDNNWTIDKIQQISKDIYKDLNGNGEYDKEDLYGMITTNGNMIDNYFISSDLPLTSNDEDGFPSLNKLTEERAVNVTQKVFDFVTQSSGVFVWTEEDTKTVHDVMFMNNQGVFYNAMLKMSKSFRAMDTDFGILPYPKYDSNQAKYETFSKAGYSAFAIPTTAPDTEFSSIIMEALCAESYKQVIPAYYDVSLKSKVSRDNESAEMLDIIREGFDFDFACVALDYTNWILLSLRNMIVAKKYTWVSDMEKVEAAITKKLEALKSTIIDNRS